MQILSFKTSTTCPFVARAVYKLQISNGFFFFKTGLCVDIRIMESYIPPFIF